MLARVREMGAIQTQWTGFLQKYKNQPDQSGNQDSGLKSGFHKVTTDNVTPGFQARVERGEIINNPFYSTLVERKDSSSTSWTLSSTAVNPPTGTLIYNAGNNVRYGPTDPSLISIPAVDVENLKTWVSTEAMAGVAEPEFDAPTFAAEFEDVIKMVYRPWKAMEDKFRRDMRSKAYQDWKRKASRRKSQWGRSSKTTDDLGNTWTVTNPYSKMRPPPPSDTSFMAYVGDTWLTYRYGLAPLVSDLSAALDLLRKDPTQYPRLTSRASGAAPIASSNVTASYSASDWAFEGTVRSEARRVVTCRAGVLYTYYTDMFSRSNFQLSGIPAAAWEGVTFSFVVDWILNVGNVLRALQPKRGVVVLAAWIVTKDDTERKYIVRANPRSNVPGWSVGGSVYYDAVRSDVYTHRDNSLRVGLAYSPMILDMSKSHWRKRCLDVAAFMGSLFGGASGRKTLT